jgi:hypothetical protein
MERKERWHRRFDRVAEGMRDLGAPDASATTRCKEQPVTRCRFTIIQFQIKPAVGSELRAFDAFTEEQSNP